MLNSTLNPILQTAIADVYDRLNTFVEDPLFTTNLVSIFGQNAAAITPKKFLNFVHHLPKIEIQKASNLQGALGAFSAQTNTIYLSDNLLNSSQSNQLIPVLLEEIGHYLDSRFNKVDTKGDEGELFSAVVRGIDLSPTELTRIQNENDQKSMVLDGKLLTVEQAASVTLPFTAVSFPKEVIPIVAGKIDFWAKLSGFSGGITLEAGPPPFFFSLTDGTSYFHEGFSWNDGRGNGGLTGIVGDGEGNTTGTNSYGYWTYENVLGTGQVDQWHHYVFQWNNNSIPGLGDKKVAIFIDGNLRSNSWSQVGQYIPLTGGSLNLITTTVYPPPPYPTPLREMAVDEFKIYDGNNNLVLWNTLGSINEIQNSSIGLNGIFNNVGDVHFIPGISGNAVIAKLVMARGIEPDTPYNLTTTNLTDTFYTKGGNDTINSTFANLQQHDILNASSGIDTLIITSGTTTNNLAIDVSNSTNQIRNIPGTIVYSFERFDLGGFLGTTNFSGSTGNDWVKGGAGNDYLGGGDGNDYLNGGAGIDTMGGGLGDDTYVIDNLADGVVEFLNNGIDTIESPFTSTLKTNLENLVLTGTSNLNGTGNELDNALSGNSGNNILDGLLGGDRLMGGLGNDTYILDSISDVVTENPNEGKDLVQSTVNTTLTNNVEDLTLLGTININGTGNNSDNTITGNSGNNLLKGLNGNDTLSGAAGNDTLVGGAGSDRLTGGEGLDQFLFGSGVAFNPINFGVDTVTDFAKGGDKISLSKASFTSLVTVINNSLQSTEFAVINSAINELILVGSSSAKVVYNQATGNLFYNPDGTTSGLTGGGQFAYLENRTNLSATDFLVQA